MESSTLAGVALGLLLAPVASRSVHRTPLPLGPRTAQSKRTATDAREEESSRAVARALDQALDEGWSRLYVEVECRTDARFQAVQIFGSGVGIWAHVEQFNLSPREMRANLEAFRELDFAGMRESYGGKNDPKTQQRRPPRLTCRIAFQFDGVSKQVVQLAGGRQSEEVKGLAHRILDICRTPARSALSADDLSDGLLKIADGRLAPETLHIQVHRKPQANPEAEGWLMNIDGLEASTRRFRAKEGYGEPRVLKLRKDELANLARQLAEQEPDQLPVNLYAEYYTDVRVEVLNRNQGIQARPFDGMTEKTLGERQKHFDEIFGLLRELHLRVLKQGRTRAQ